MAQANTEVVVAKLRDQIGQLALDRAITESALEHAEQENAALTQRVDELTGLLEAARSAVAASAKKGATSD